MSNKFKIRNLENEIRRIQKQIVKLKEEDKKPKQSRVIAVVTEERNSVIKSILTRQEVSQVFKYVFVQKGNTEHCTLTDGTSDVVGEGSATCHEDDVFVDGIGCSLAERRAVIDYYTKIERLETKEYN